MEQRTARFKENQMRGKAYTFTISLYCTLMIWSAFVSIDRQAYASAGVAAGMAEKVRAGISRGFPGVAVPATEADAPAARGVIKVSAAQSQAKGLATFKEASDMIVAKGVDQTVGVAFCARFEIDCGGKPWPIKGKQATSSIDRKIAAVGFSAGRETVILDRQDLNKATGELYVCDAEGNLLRGYHFFNNNAPIRLTPAQARAGFEAEKQWWMDWLPDHVGDAPAAKP